MDDCGAEVSLEVLFGAVASVEVNEGGILQIVLNLFASDEGNSQKVRIDFYNVTEKILSHHKDTGEYHHLFAISEEMSREAERIRMEAVSMSDSEEAVADLFNV